MLHYVLLFAVNSVLLHYLHLSNTCVISHWQSWRRALMSADFRLRCVTTVPSSVCVHETCLFFVIMTLSRQKQLIRQLINGVCCRWRELDSRRPSGWWMWSVSACGPIWTSDPVQTQIICTFVDKMGWKQMVSGWERSVLTGYKSHTPWFGCFYSNTVVWFIDNLINKHWNESCCNRPDKIQYFHTNHPY